MSQLMNTTIDRFKVQMLMKDKTGNELKLFEAIKKFKDLSKSWVEEWDKDIKEKFLNHIKSKIGVFKLLAGAVNKSTPKLIEKGLESLKSPDDIINIFTELGDMMGVIADNQNIFLDIAENENYKNKNFSMLRKNQQQEIANLLGFKDNKFEDGSVLKKLHTTLNSKTINDLILDHESPL